MAGVMDVTKVIGAMRAICASQDIHDECESLLWVNLSDPAHSGAADLRDSGMPARDLICDNTGVVIANVTPATRLACRGVIKALDVSADCLAGVTEITVANFAGEAKPKILRAIARAIAVAKTDATTAGAAAGAISTGSRAAGACSFTVTSEEEGRLDDTVVETILRTKAWRDIMTLVSGGDAQKVSDGLHCDFTNTVSAPTPGQQALLAAFYFDHRPFRASGARPDKTFYRDFVDGYTKIRAALGTPVALLLTKSLSYTPDKAFIKQTVEKVQLFDARWLRDHFCIFAARASTYRRSAVEPLRSSASTIAATLTVKKKQFPRFNYTMTLYEFGQAVSQAMLPCLAKSNPRLMQLDLCVDNFHVLLAAFDGMESAGTVPVNSTFNRVKILLDMLIVPCMIECLRRAVVKWSHVTDASCGPPKKGDEFHELQCFFDLETGPKLLGDVFDVLMEQGLRAPELHVAMSGFANKRAWGGSPRNEIRLAPGSPGGQQLYGRQSAMTVSFPDGAAISQEAQASGQRFLQAQSQLRLPLMGGYPAPPPTMAQGLAFPGQLLTDGQNMAMPNDAAMMTPAQFEASPHFKQLVDTAAAKRVRGRSPTPHERDGGTDGGAGYSDHDHDERPAIKKPTRGAQQKKERAEAAERASGGGGAKARGGRSSSPPTSSGRGRDRDRDKDTRQTKQQPTRDEYNRFYRSSALPILQRANGSVRCAECPDQCNRKDDRCYNPEECELTWGFIHSPKTEKRNKLKYWKDVRDINFAFLGSFDLMPGHLTKKTVKEKCWPGSR